MSTMSADLPPNGGLNGVNGHKQNGKKHLKPTAIVDNFSHLHIKTQTSGVTTDSQPGTTRRSNRSEPFFIGVAGSPCAGLLSEISFLNRPTYSLPLRAGQ